MAGSNDAISVAIELFRASQESSTAMGRPVLATLEAASKSGKITFAQLPMGLDGQQRGDTIEMNESLRNDPGKLSVWLVHEGYHLAMKRRELEVDEEIKSRQIQGQYSLSLMRGIPYDGTMYTVKRSAVVDAYLKDQVIDWVLGLPDYSDKEGFLTQSWIGAHIHDWKGAANRTIFAKRKYVAILVKPPKLVDRGPGGRALFALLSSSSVGDARSLISHAGDGDYAKGLKLVSERISHALWGEGGETGKLTKDVLQWQRETGIDLGVAARQ